jgi:hypothetical protein
VGKNYAYKFEDDLCSLVKVFLGKYLGINVELEKINNNGNISNFASQSKKVWTKAYKKYSFIKTLLELVKSNNYSRLKKLMKNIEIPIIE